MADPGEDNAFTMRGKAQPYLVALAVAAQIGVAGAQEEVGRGRLTRYDVRNFEEFADLSLQELVGKDELRFALNLFGDLGGGVFFADETTSNFHLGQVGLLANADLGNDVRSLVEIVVESGEGHEAVIDLERLWLRWDHERFFVLGGRMHTDFGYWNTAYHHGAWLQPTIDRPRSMAFEDEGGVLPVHNTGVQLGYMVPVAQGLELHLRGTLANGRGDGPDDIRVVDDTNNAKTVVLQAFVRSGRDWRVGASFLYDRIAAAPAEVRPDLPDQGMNELIGAVHAVWFHPRFTFIGESFLSHYSAGSQTWTNLFGFAVLAVHFRPFSPYLRLEGFSHEGDTQNPFFVADLSAPGATLERDQLEIVSGLRWDVSTWSALKVEHRWRREINTKHDDNTLIANWAFGI